MTKVRVGIPTYGHIDPKWFSGWLGISPQPDEVKVVTDQFVPDARNMLVDWFLGTGPQPHDYLLFLDSDVVPPSNIIELVREYTQPVVAGIYTYRHQNFHKVIASRNDVSLTEIPEGFTEVDFAPAGCMAIRADILQGWPWDRLPRFAWVSSKIGRGTAEDVYFGQHLKSMGIPVVIDSRLICDHIGSYHYRP